MSHGTLPQMSPSTTLLLSYVLFLGATGGCGDDSSAPEAQGSYLISAYLSEDFATANVKVARRDGRASPSPACTATIDGSAMQLDPESSDDEAFFQLSVEPMLGRAHSVVVALSGRTATGLLVSPTASCTLFVRRPPPDSLYYRSGQGLTLEWEYSGDIPTEFQVVTTVPRGIFPLLYFDTVGPDTTAVVIPSSTTSQWGSGPQVFLDLHAYRKAGITGELAATGSTATVSLATSRLTLRPR